MAHITRIDDEPVQAPSPEPIPVYDATVLSELGEVFGRERLRHLLVLLRAEIAGRLRDEDDRPALMRDAHVLLSSSGSLGFLALSRSCTALERACMDGIDVAPTLDAARRQASLALSALDVLVEEDGR